MQQSSKKRPARKGSAKDTIIRERTALVARVDEFLFPLTTTQEEAGRMAESILAGLDYDGDDVARLLLLCHLLTYTRGLSKRENIMVSIERACAPYLSGYDAMMRAEMDFTLETLRKGEASR
jgi:hypothetical protein